MNFLKMYTGQATLMAKIEERNPANGEDRSAMKFVGMLTEFAECINEHRGFKFWSADREPRKPLLEEYNDGIHWLLEFGIDNDFYVTENYTLICEEETVEQQFIEVITLAIEFYKNKSMQNYANLFYAYLGLGNLMGFSTDQIEAGFFEKNKINMERQANGY